MKNNIPKTEGDTLKALNQTCVAAAIIDNNNQLIATNDLLLTYFDCEYSQIQDDNYIDFIVLNFSRFKKSTLQRWLRQKFNNYRSEFLLKLKNPGPTAQKQIESQRTGFKKNTSSHKVSKSISSANNFQNKTYYYVQIISAEFKSQKCKIITLTDISSAIVVLNYERNKNKLKQKDIKVARRIQKSINNYSIPYIEGRYLKYHCTSIFQPKSILSGDILNMRQINRRYFSFFIGDGRGHGLSAALYSTLLNSYTSMMSAQILRGKTDPAFLLRKVNQLAYRDFSQSFNQKDLSNKLKEQYFFSGIYGIVDGNNRKMKITNAGHPFAYCLYEGKITVMPSDGPLIGILANEKFNQQTVHLKHGQLFLFFTDGMYDIVPTNLNYSFNTLLLACITKLYKDANHNSAKFLIEFKKYIHNEQKKGSIQDDLSLLTLLIEEKG